MADTIYIVEDTDADNNYYGNRGIEGYFSSAVKAEEYLVELCKKFPGHKREDYAVVPYVLDSEKVDSTSTCSKKENTDA